ncbi:MAG: sigma factor-like helix-turn-helix DNA-binding protein [Dehalococcoidia bacterium]
MRKPQARNLNLQPLTALSRDEECVLTLRLLCRLSTVEVARQLDISLPQVRAVQLRALRRLQTRAGQVRQGERIRPATG